MWLCEARINPHNPPFSHRREGSHTVHHAALWSSVLTWSRALGWPGLPCPNIQHPHVAQGVPPLQYLHYVRACSLANLRVSKHTPGSASTTHFCGCSAGVHAVNCEIPTSELPVSDLILVCLPSPHSAAAVPRPPASPFSSSQSLVLCFSENLQVTEL